MVWPMDLNHLYYLGHGATLAMDSMYVSGFDWRHTPAEKLKIPRNDIKTRKDAEGIASICPKNGFKWSRRAVQFLLWGCREVRNPVVYFAKRNYFAIALICKDLCVRKGIATKNTGDSKKYSAPFYFPTNLLIMGRILAPCFIYVGSF